MRRLMVAALVATALALGGTANAGTNTFSSPAHLVAGRSAAITVDNTILTWKTFIVMPGVDFLPRNGSCYTHLRLPAGYLPNFVWVCQDRSVPIVFSSPAVAPSDLIADTLHTWGTGYVGLVGTGGVSRGAWTLSSPPAKYDYRPASTL